MTSLFTLWTLSLIVMGVLLVLAHLRFIAAGRGRADLPMSVREFLHGELSLGKEFADEISGHVVRYTRDMGVKAKVPLAKGHMIVMERIFGAQEVAKGGTASFFLKHIAEFKEKNKRESPGKEIG